MNKFPKLNAMLQENYYKDVDSLTSYSEVIEEEVSKISEFILLWGLHTDIVKDCNQKLKDQNITPRMNMNNLFQSCFGRRMMIIDYYLELEAIGLEINQIQRS